jgi:chromosome segregation ATPase
MEEQVSHLSELEGLNSELDGLLSDLKGREENSFSRIRGLETQLEAARDLAASASARLAAREEALSAALQEAKASLATEASRSAALASEREDLAARLESVSRLFEEEKARSSEKEVFMKSCRAALKDKDAETGKIWRAMEGLKEELDLERAAVRDREARLQNFIKTQQVLEQKLAQADRDGARAEEGFLLKVDLIKKELKEQVRRSGELERSLAAAGKRLDEALEEVEEQKSLLAANPSGVLEKFRAWQAALSGLQSELRGKEEENAALRGREDSRLAELRDAEEKWKQAAGRLQEAVSKLRAAENEKEISAGRIKALEAERDKLRSGVTAAALASHEAKARDGEAAGFMAALREQADKYAELLRKYDDIVLANRALEMEKAVVRVEAESLRARLEVVETGAAGANEAGVARDSLLFDRARNAESLLKKKELELEETRAALADIEGECELLRRSRSVGAGGKLLIKEKMLAEINARMKKLGGDFEELKKRGQAAGGPGYSPEFEELAAGIAHQTADSISIIRSHAEFCAESPEAEGARESLSVIVRNIAALQKKLEIIMNFSRPVIPRLSPEKLSVIASETLESLRAAGRLGTVRAGIEAQGELPPIRVDRVRLAAAIEQLLLNAVESRPRGGELLLKFSVSGGGQRLEITDTGEGVEKKNINAVFRPFFTTRPGKMGLGLALARNVALAHGGTLELDSQPGRGSRVVRELPGA